MWSLFKDMLKAILPWVISKPPLNKRQRIQKRQIKNGQSREIGNIRQTRHRTKTKHKQNIICVGHHHTQNTTQRQTKQKTQHRKPKRSTTLTTPTPLQHLNTNVYKVCLTYFNQQKENVWGCIAQKAHYILGIFNGKFALLSM